MLAVITEADKCLHQVTTNLKDVLTATGDCALNGDPGECGPPGPDRIIHERIRMCAMKLCLFVQLRTNMSFRVCYRF